jgi:hypothetical protein
MFGSKEIVEDSPEELRAAQQAADGRFAIYRRRCIFATTAFVVSCAFVVPFLAGYPLHPYWDVVGKYLLLLSMALLLVFLYFTLLTFGAWQIRRNYRNIENSQNYSRTK